ncbi:MAG TPA: hypothetical protein VGR70_15475 [Stellaceae bacterium]|nr:hypothetical protein [Stellaceae bacterium]
MSPIKVAGCSTETALNLWKVKRVNNPPGQKALNTKRSRMRDLFAHLNIADDLTLPTDEQLQSYKEHLLNLGGNALCFDHFTHICALYRVADQNNKFRGIPGGNPCAKISLPPKPDGLRRLSLSDAETKKILLAAREHNDPVVKWGELLMAGLGLIVKEISEARVGHVRSVGGTVCLEITAKDRREIVDGVEQASKQLKTQFRTRLLPIPGWVLDEGFVERIEYLRASFGEGAALFEEIEPDKAGLRNTKMSAILMRFLRDLGIVNQIDPDTGKTVALRDNYGWRHRFASLLQDTSTIPGSTQERRRYMCGHAGKDVHEKTYLDHEVPKVKLILDALPDPLKLCTTDQAA